MTRTPRLMTTLAVAAPLAFLLLAGCRVTENDHGDKKNVDIGTPFGSVKVHTGNGTDTSALGLTPYPGAVPINDDGDKDGNSANVDLSFGGFHLGVKAADFQTPDSQDKVLAFYRKDLATRYGSVIECRGHSAVGSLTHTPEGLTCSDSEGSHTKISDNHSKGVAIMSGDSSGKLELRAGSAQHQHIVGAEAHDSGTRIGLVDLDLPSQVSDQSSKNREE